MGVPKRKTSKANKRSRRAMDKIVIAGFAKCPHCQALILQHHVCSECGYYNGRAVVAKAE